MTVRGQPLADSADAQEAAGTDIQMQGALEAQLSAFPSVGNTDLNTSAGARLRLRYRMPGDDRDEHSGGGT